MHPAAWRINDYSADYINKNSHLLLEERSHYNPAFDYELFHILRIFDSR